MRDPLIFFTAKNDNTLQPLDQSILRKIFLSKEDVTNTCLQKEGILESLKRVTLKVFVLLDKKVKPKTLKKSWKNIMSPGQTKGEKAGGNGKSMLSLANKPPVSETFATKLMNAGEKE